MSQMTQFVATMPEAKFRTTKKRVKQARPIRASEQHHEARTMQLVVVEKNVASATTSAPLTKKTEATKTLKAAVIKTEKAKSALNIASLWPVALGIFLSGFAPEWHTMAAQAGVWTMRAIFPLTLLATHREIGIDAQMATMLPGFALYAQFPIDGLLTMLTLVRGRSLKSAIIQVVLVHGLCTLVLWLIGTNIA